MQPVVNIYAKGGTQNELPSFSNKKIIVIRLSVVRSAVRCYLNPWSVRDSFNKENMFNSCYSLLTSPIKVLASKAMKHGHLKSRERPITTSTSFFLTLTKKPTCLHFSCKFLAMFGFQKWVFKAGGEGGCQIFDPWEAQNLLVPSKVPSRSNWLMQNHMFTIISLAIKKRH